MRPTPNAVLEVDLDAVAANWQDLRVRHRADVAAVLKGDFYGLGAAPAARRLMRAGCRHYFTAQLAEAVALRPLLENAMVAVLGGLIDGDEAIYRAHDIWPVLGSLDEIGRWRARGHGCPALVHVDTGMSRLGLPADELAVLQAEPHRLDGVDVRFVMTHLTDAERPDAPANAAQAAAFAAAFAAVPQGRRASLANSSGMYLGDAFASSLARAGAGLVGINPTPGAAHPLRAAATLRARVLQLRAIGPGERVGYGGTWIATRPSRIATVGIGYADGWPVALSNRGRAHFDGGTLPLVGRVSMDLTTLDATGCATLRVGDMVELIGPAIPVETVAADAGTLPYEILTRLGARITRVYHG